MTAAQTVVLAAAHSSLGEAVGFWILAPIAVIAALGMVASRSAVHGALLLAVDMLGLAVLYGLQQAPFLMFVQIIVYTGAIMMLFLFVLMLVGVDSSDSLVETLRGQRVAAVLLGVGFAILLLAAIGDAVAGDHPVGLAQANAIGNVQGLAQLLFTRYVFAFEGTSALLITAAVGAMVLTHRERLTARRTQKELMQERFRGPRPSPLPSPGVYADHNAVDTPALLPDGTASEESVPATVAEISRHRFPSPAEIGYRRPGEGEEGR